MKTVIVEDEPLIARDLQKMLHQVAPDAEVLATLGSLAAAKAWFASHPEPDLILMDIQLSDGVSFDLFSQVSLSCPIIFTTAYNEYAIRAFKVNSIDYLLKPVDSEDLQTALDKFRKLRLPTTDFGQQLAALIRDLRPSEPVKPLFKERFMAHFKNTLMPVPAEKVGYFVKNELIYLVTSDHQKLVTDYDAMDEIEQQVNPVHFFRANRQYIIRLESVAHYKTHYNGKLIVKLQSPLNVEVEVSREKASEFRKWLSG
jgi:two-component system, LytTR family, response regulator